MGEHDDELKKLRKEMGETVIDFTTDSENNNKILLLQPTQGVGKTITTALNLFSRDDIATIFLSYNHDHLTEVENNAFLDKFNLLHLKGPDKPKDEPLCKNLKERRVLSKYSIDLHQVLCNEKGCEYFHNCGYLNQFRELKDKTESWVGMHSHLNTPIINSYVKNVQKTGKKVCLVIDENPFLNLNMAHPLNSTDLMDINRVIVNRLKGNKPNQVNSLEISLKSFISIIDKTKKQYESAKPDGRENIGIDGISFVEEFISGIESDSLEQVITDIIGQEMDD